MQNDQIAAVVPVKMLGRAKGRLAEALTPQERRALVLAMLRDVLGALRAVLGSYAVISSDLGVLAFAAAYGAVPLFDKAADLNGALAQAAAHYAAAGAAGLLVLPADVPLVAADDLGRLIAAAACSRVLVAPSRDGGTNALLVRPPQALPFQFGADSMALHLDAARRLSLPAATVRLPSLALDVDRPADLQLLAEAPGQSTAQRLVRSFAVRNA
jgi:2-phospho-L-lactate guanylyltransferase